MEPPNPSPSLLSSLPKHIVLSILGRIPRSYNLTLSLVSKSFRSLIISEELEVVRSHLGTREACICVCLQSRTDLCDRRWFSLWIKPDDHQTLITDCTIEYKCTENWLLPVPSYYCPRSPLFQETVGSETYEIGGQDTPSSSTDVWVYNKLIGEWCKAPSMLVARKNALTCSLDGKLYVMGGCKAPWAEVFDPKTQTWEPLPDPGADLRFSSVKKLEAHRGKIYVRSNQKNFVYLTKERRWEVVNANLSESMCEIDNVWYCYDHKECLWYDTTREQWRLVKGLRGFDRPWRIHTEIGNYGGKLVVVWVSPSSEDINIPEIWCAVILLQKCHDGEIWGQIEWTDVVLRVPRSYALLHSLHSLQ